MKELVKQFQESMSRISDDEFLKVWDELKEYNEIGPIASEYFEQVLSRINNFQITNNINFSYKKEKSNSSYGEECLFKAA